MSASNADFRARYGPWALVAGASEGLGEAFADQLAARGLNLVLLARRAEVLATVGQAVAARHGVEVRTHALDLSRPDLDTALATVTDGLTVGLAVYNAALAPQGPMLDHALPELLRAIDVNCRGPLVMAHVLGRWMADRGRGGVVLMTSLAGTQGSPGIATYAATKAFNLVLAEGLWAEFQRRGVDVIACRAGATRTPGYLRTRSAPAPGELDAAPVVSATLDALGHGPSVIPGWVNRLAALVLGRFLPRRMAVRVMERAYVPAPTPPG